MKKACARQVVLDKWFPLNVSGVGFRVSPLSLPGAPALARATILLTTYYLLPTNYYLLLTIHYTLYPIHYALYTIYYTLYTILY